MGADRAALGTAALGYPATATRSGYPCKSEAALSPRAAAEAKVTNADRTTGHIDRHSSCGNCNYTAYPTAGAVSTIAPAPSSEQRHNVWNELPIVNSWLPAFQSVLYRMQTHCWSGAC